MVIHYAPPKVWIKYDFARVVPALIEAKAAVISLKNVPYQKSWAERLQDVQLKHEVAGTSKIEGAEFTENELEAALQSETPEDAMTRSQRQARAAVNTYRWISALEEERPITADIILEIHRRIVTGCDDDHCPPGELRTSGQNVTFGSPRHRGSEGGKECKNYFAALTEALNHEFKSHDVLIQALAFHYHIGAMHPFLDGNGRTARAVEALMLQRAGLRDGLFIALSNYYYDEKAGYLKSLSAVRATDGDLTEFIVFGLTGIAKQCSRLLAEITRNISKALFRDMATELFGRLVSTKKRVIANRQMALINILLEKSPLSVNDLFKSAQNDYKRLKEPWAAFVRDILALEELGTLRIKNTREANRPIKVIADIRLEWPTEITETEFFEKTRELPRAKTFNFLRRQ